MPEPDWALLGRHLYDALGVVARERSDLHGDDAYGEALRLVTAAGLLVTLEAHRAAVAEADRVADGNRVLLEAAHRDRLAEAAERQRPVDRQIAEALAGLADELRAKAGREPAQPPRAARCAARGRLARGAGCATVRRREA